MRWSVAALFGSVVTLSGAFLVGVVIHRSLVVGEFSPLSPPAVFGAIGGVALILVGRRLEERFEPSDYVPASEDEDDEDEETDGREFDERLSPVPQDRLERREADESAVTAGDEDGDESGERPPERTETGDGDSATDGTAPDGDADADR